MKTKEIKQAAEQYRLNRNNQKSAPWNKEADCDNLFSAMKDVGLRSCSATAGTFMGHKENGKLFIIDIGEHKIGMGTYKNWTEWWNKAPIVD